MAANNAESIRFAPHGKVYVAPVGTVGPTDVTTPMGSGWKELGYITEDGVSLTPSIETNPVTVWQAATPVKYVVNSASFQLQFTLSQFDKDATELYFGASFEQAVGEDGSTPIEGVYVLDLSSTPDLAERAMVVEWGDGSVVNRLHIPRGMISEREGLTLTRTDAQTLGVTFDALDAGGKLGHLLTNDPAMTPEGVGGGGGEGSGDGQE